ncbi:hypothetical protein KIH31_05270 [Paenarthrobacter sp. DKR-5]|uniref:hypothetical protein n=1 Tax=Paenarthrobacter sp. DKR-5 TaxID=2835535 RepID=UPI001BDDA396|nr:hypothetical protein [Paenarthrobacter sp. DKR-5]MBT1002009.1 hypothetical protein [Paenarthrobacter sp. DKR-5]
MPHKLKVVVRLDMDLRSALIEVRGIVTSRNVRALYAIARRTNAMVPHVILVVDLRYAVVQAEPLDELTTSSRTGRLPAGSDPFNAPCELRLLEPAAA